MWKPRIEIRAKGIAIIPTPSPATCRPGLSLLKAVLWGSCAETLELQVMAGRPATLLYSQNTRHLVK